MDAIDPAQWNTVVQVGAPVLGLMVCGNIMFALRMLSKLDRIDETVTGTFPVFKSQMQANEGAIAKLSQDVKEIGSLRERVAVIEYVTKAGKVIQA